MSKRIIFTVSRTIEEFLEKMTRETGMDLSNLLRMRLWEWYVEERERALDKKQSGKQHH